MQVARLKDLGARPELPRPFARHLIGAEVLGWGQEQDDMIALLTRYRDEWMHIASDANQKGLPWARLLAASQPRTQGVAYASA
jgi:hypothetical protein